jgi:mannose-6-phosphate isomerase-like protein (cupin superfamily)
VELEIKRFGSADEARTFEAGRFDLITVGGMTLGRAMYQPGWKWSEHVGRETGESSCQVEHIGIVVAGRAMVAMDDGTEIELRAGDAFAIPPGHDSWVIGDEPYTSLHLLGAESYARTEGAD